MVDYGLPKIKFLYAVISESYVKLKELYKKQGLLFIASNLLKMTPFCYWYYKKFKKNNSFITNGKPYKYFCGYYNCTWLNERAVEVPICRDIINKNQGKMILEVGNVLSHYFKVNHDIIDKYEVAKGLMNLDAVDFKPEKNMT